MDQETRASLWEAFSDFFVDTEVSDPHFRHAARVIARSGVSTADAERVLWNEVFPVLHPNLSSVAGQWTGWSRDWLEAHLRPAPGPARRVGPASAVREIRRCWARVLEHLEARA